MSEELSDKEMLAFNALEDLLRRVRLQQVTGHAYLRLDANQGHLTKVTLTLEETYKQRN
jgi:hypothetical protein